MSHHAIGKIAAAISELGRVPDEERVKPVGDRVRRGEMRGRPPARAGRSRRCTTLPMSIVGDRAADVAVPAELGEPADDAPPQGRTR